MAAGGSAAAILPVTVNGYSLLPVKCQPDLTCSGCWQE